MVSGETMNAPQKFKQPLTARWVTPMVWMANEAPANWDDNQGTLAKRFKLVEFLRRRAGHARDPGLSARVLAQLQKSTFSIFQLDAVAYPGNSGSPLYDPDNGTVYGVLNMVMVKSLKENAISNPTGISYAIPATYIRALLERKPN